ncbi:TetR/AcrR family transcriptional regulator, partial [Burkholderia cenocepacia]|uniref:TetR/AcrR family transcriptional regulator n=1 Tax=Burkholderia cenocepacia TaxID=95486 RepID=UPI0038CC0EEF
MSAVPAAMRAPRASSDENENDRFTSAVYGGSMPMRTSTRDRVLDAADALFAAHGIAATPVDAVLARAGVSSATLYRGYASKEALLAYP